MATHLKTKTPHHVHGCKRHQLLGSARRFSVHSGILKYTRRRAPTFWYIEAFGVKVLRREAGPPPGANEGCTLNHAVFRVPENYVQTQTGLGIGIGFPLISYINWSGIKADSSVSECRTVRKPSSTEYFHQEPWLTKTQWT